jgi:hypothetical protein
VSRVVHSFATRVGDGDIDALPDLEELRRQLERETAAAVATLRAAPHFYSWKQIADRLGITRQAAMRRWPQPDKAAARQPGGQPVRLR